MVQVTILGHPDYAERLARLLRTDDEAAQLDILSSEFTAEEIREIGRALIQKTLGEATGNEIRLLGILELHAEELEIVDLLREFFKGRGET